MGAIRPCPHLGLRIAPMDAIRSVISTAPEIFLLFAIALKRIGVLVNADGTNGIIQHLSKLGKEKDKQGGYG